MQKYTFKIKYQVPTMTLCESKLHLVHLVQFGFIWFNLVQIGSIWFNLIQFDPFWAKFWPLWITVYNFGPLWTTCISIEHFQNYVFTHWWPRKNWLLFKYYRLYIEGHYWSSRLVSLLSRFNYHPIWLNLNQFYPILPKLTEFDPIWTNKSLFKSIRSN